MRQFIKVSAAGLMIATLASCVLWPALSSFGTSESPGTERGLESVNREEHLDAVQEAQQLIPDLDCQIALMKKDVAEFGEETQFNDSAIAAMTEEAKGAVEKALCGLDQLESELEGLNSEIIELVDEAAQCDAKSAKQVELAKQISAKRTEIQAAIEATQTKIAMLEREEGNLNAEIDRLNSTVSQAQRSASGLQTDAGLLQRGIAVLRAYKSSLKLDIETLEKLLTPPPPPPPKRTPRRDYPKPPFVGPRR